MACTQNIFSLFKATCGSVFYILGEKKKQRNSETLIFCYGRSCCDVYKYPSSKKIAQCEVFVKSNCLRKVKVNIHSRGSFAFLGMGDLPRECISENGETSSFLSASIPRVGQASAAY